MKFFDKPEAPNPLSPLDINLVNYMWREGRKLFVRAKIILAEKEAELKSLLQRLDDEDLDYDLRIAYGHYETQLRRQIQDLKLILEE